ncbi:MAG: electron transfer flavoprotein beta subunit/FixA family protein, partial [Gemmatimonadetes bacterium]|nr:electron transfer flavoprotein beta subunit/FixA family protein [Gemmatimonadota bacterium]
MRTIVCIKRVPDSEARVRISADGRGIDPSGMKFAMNPYDEIALEAALQLKEKAGDGAVTAITVGSVDAKETLRSALAMGADDGVLLRSECSIDGLTIARALADEVSGRQYDLLLFGK